MVQPFVLELDGKLAGRFLSFDYSSPEMVVVSRLWSKSQMSLVPGSPGKMTASFAGGLSDSFYKWVASVAGNKSSPSSGSVYALDANSKPKSRITFRDALIESLTLPELKGGTKDSAFVTVVFRPEQVKHESIEPGSGKVDLGVYTSNQAKASRISDFKLRIDDLDDACSWVSRISPITVGRKIQTDSTGPSRHKYLVPASSNYSNLIFDLSLKQTAKFEKWMEETLAGKLSQERSGSLDLLAPGLTKTYFEVRFRGLGMFGFSKLDSNTARVELYCSGLSFTAGSSAIL